MTSDTVSRKPSARIIPYDSSRERSKASQPLPGPSESAFEGTRQMRSSASSSSPKTEAAPASNSANPNSVAATPLAG